MAEPKPFAFTQAELSDIASLSDFAKRVFTATFGKDNTPENMELYLRSAFGHERLKTEIVDAHRVTTLARRETRIAGYYQLHRANGDAKIELVRLYVDPTFHGHGLAHNLMHHLIEEAQARQAKQIWLGVWEHNHRAQAFYRKFGFKVTGSHAFMLGEDRQTDLIMTRQLANSGAQ